MAYVHEVFHLLPLHATLQLALLSGVEPATIVSEIVSREESTEGSCDLHVSTLR